MYKHTKIQITYNELHYVMSYLVMPAFEFLLYRWQNLIKGVKGVCKQIAKTHL